MAIAGVKQDLGPDGPAHRPEAGLPGRRRHAGPVFTEDAQILWDRVIAMDYMKLYDLTRVGNGISFRKNSAE